MAKPQYLKGKFLISVSTSSDPSFSKTVVFILEHDKEGAFGLVINRPSESSLFDVLEGMPAHAKKIFLFTGGPVQQEALFVLHKNSELVEEPNEQTVREGVYWGSSHNLLSSLLGETLPFSVFHGYAGWSGGQLEAELRQNRWIVVSADDDKLFNISHKKTSDLVWREFLEREGGIYAYFAKTVQDPSLN